MKTIAASFALVLAGCGAAIAADLSYEAPPPQQIFNPASAVDWSGFHFGGNIGFGTGSAGGTFTFAGVSTPVAGFSPSGWLGGVQAGYDVQNGQFVYGVEGDIDASGINGTGTQFSGGGLTITASSKLNWVGTFRGRLGYAFQRLLVYATGGIAVGNNTVTIAATGFAPFANTQTHVGWTAGVGAEYALNRNWSVGGEYRYVDLGSATYSFSALPGLTTRAKATAHTFMVRANYHF